MKNKNKQKYNMALMIPTVILIFVGLAGFFFRPVNGIDMLQIVSDDTARLIQIIGTVLTLAGLILMYFAINSTVNNDKDLKISENDERYNMIRGKAAQICSLVSSYLLVALLFVFIIMDLSTPAIMLGVVMFINNWVNIFAVGYYDKKM